MADLCLAFCRVSNRAASRAAAAASAFMPLARRRTQRRPVRAGSSGSRGTATRGATVRRPMFRGGQDGRVAVVFGLAFMGGGSGRVAVRARYDGPLNGAEARQLSPAELVELVYETGRSSLIVVSEAQGLSQVLVRDHRDRPETASQYPQLA